MSNDMNDFSKSLLRAAKNLDAPASGAKDRAIAHVASAAIASSAAAATGASVVTTGVAMKLAPWAAAALFTVAGASGAYYAGSHNAKAPTSSSPAIVASPGDTIANSVARSAVAAANARERDVTPSAEAAAANANAKACGGIAFTETSGLLSKTGGESMSLDLSIGCAGQVDIYWVDFKGVERFRGRYGTGEHFLQHTYEGHAWRLRDHATQRAIKEFLSTSVAPKDAPKAAPDGGRIELPSVVLRPEDPALPDEPPTICSRGGQESKILYRNDRDKPVAIFFVDRECKEVFGTDLAPHASMHANARDAEAFRVRDSESSVILAEVVPSAPDTTTYETVP